MKLLKYLPISIILLVTLFGQELEYNLISPKLTKAGIVATDDIHSTLYFVKNNEITTLLNKRGCGNYFTISPSEEEIGIKIIDDFGMETPAIFNLDNNKLSNLYEPVNNAGQVSFSDNGLIAFTIGNELHLSDGRKFDLGNYANLAPISPNGKLVAFNNDDDQIFILNLETAEKKQITDQKFSYYNPQWSPNSQKLLVNRFDSQICIYSDGKLTAINKGHSPSWQDDEIIIFYKKEIENMKLVNTDLFSVNSNGTNLTQISDTKNKMEIDPSFDKNTRSITYSDIKINSLETISTKNILSN